MLLGCESAFSQSSAQSTMDEDNVCAPETMVAYLRPVDDEEGSLDNFTVGEVCDGKSSRGAGLRPVSFKSDPSAATITMKQINPNATKVCTTPCWMNVDPEEDLDFSITFPSGLNKNVAVAVYEDRSIETGVWIGEVEEGIITLYMALFENFELPEEHFGQDSITMIDGTQRNKKKRLRVMMTVKEDCIYTHDFTSDGLITTLKFENCGDVATQQAVLNWELSGRSKFNLKNDEQGYVIGVGQHIRYVNRNATIGSGNE